MTLREYYGLLYINSKLSILSDESFYIREVKRRTRARNRQNCSYASRFIKSSFNSLIIREEFDYIFSQEDEARYLCENYRRINGISRLITLYIKIFPCKKAGKTIIYHALELDA